MYCRAVLPSAGLGNKLFPWARCRIYSLEHHIPMLAPHWTQLKFQRVYWNLFNSRARGYVRSSLGLMLRTSTAPRLDEPADLHTPPRDRCKPGVMVFDGERDHFRSLNGRNELLHQELVHMTRQRWRARADEVGPVEIGIHVRRGDFVEASSPHDFVLRGAIRTPLDWFVTALSTIRQMCGRMVPAVVVSDAPDDSLMGLLRLDAVRRVTTGSAIGDLLVLSRARLLIASGGSTFSAWAAFLGQMPTVAYPGQSLTWFQIEPARGQYVGVLDHTAEVPRPLLDQMGVLQ
jgi:hypothetical protein